MTTHPLRLALAGLLFAAAGLAAPAAAQSPRQGATLGEAATNICIARGNKQGTPAFDKCYQDVLVELTIMISDGIGE